MEVERALEHERLRQRGVEVRGHRQRRGQRGRVGEERVGTQGHLGGLVVARHQRARVRGPELLPPQARDPLRMGVHDGGLLGAGLGQARQQAAGPLAGGAAQHRVDQAVPCAAGGLGVVVVREDDIVGRHVATVDRG